MSDRLDALLDRFDEPLLRDVVDQFLRQTRLNSHRSLASRHAGLCLLLEWCAWRSRLDPRPDPLRMTDEQIALFQEWLRDTPQPSTGGRPFKTATRENYEHACKQFGLVAARKLGLDSRWMYLRATSSPSRHTVPRPRLSAEAMSRLADAADRDRRLNLQGFDVVETPAGVLTPQGRCLVWMMTRLLRRADDVCAINVDDLTPVPHSSDPARWWYVLHAREKFGKRDQVDVPEDVSRDLWVWLSGHRRQLVAHFGSVADIAGDPVFIHPRLGRRLRRSVLGRIVEEASDLSGLTADIGRSLTPQDLRSAGITWLLEQGFELDDVQKLSGHRDVRTLQRYRNDVRSHDHLPQIRAAEHFRYSNASRVAGPLAGPRNAKPPRNTGCRCDPAWPVLHAAVPVSDETVTVVCQPAATPTPEWAADLAPRCGGCAAPYIGSVAVVGRLRPVADDAFVELLATGPVEPSVTFSSAGEYIEWKDEGR